MTRFIWDKFSKDFGEGIYLLPEPLKTGVVVIHQLPETPETLWLRLIGRGRKRDEAIAELESLPPDSPLRSDTLELLYNVSRNLEAAAKTTQEDRELIMRLAPLYQQEKAQILQEGRPSPALLTEPPDWSKALIPLIAKPFVPLREESSNIL